MEKGIRGSDCVCDLNLTSSYLLGEKLTIDTAKSAMDWKFIGNNEKDTTGTEHGFTRIRRIFTDNFNPCRSVSSVQSVFYSTLLYFLVKRNIFANFALR